MANVSHFNIMGKIVDIKDNTARAGITNLNNEVTRLDGRIDTTNLNLGNAINTVDGKVDGILNSQLTEMVVLGDSFSLGTLSGGGVANPNMSTMIADMLKLVLHNYGVNGAGYTINANTFQMQLESAIADTSYDHNKVKYVFVIGGINDLNFNKLADHATASKNLQINIHAAFPNAIVVLTPCWAAPALTSGDEQIFRNICSAAGSFTKTIMLYDNIKCLMGYSSLIGSDYIHPTAKGYMTLAENIVSLMQGSGLARGKQIGKVANSNWDVSNVNIFRGEDFIRIYGFAKANVAITTPTQLTICEVNNGAPYAGSLIKICPSANRYVLLQFNPSDDLGDTSRGSIVLLNDYGTSVAANDMIFFDELIPLLNL